jgi:predicted Zn-dependent protease
MEKAQYADAEVLLRKCSTLAPKSDAVWYYFSMCLNSVGKFNNAAVATKNALALKPDNPSYMRILKNAYSGLNENDAAFELAEKILEKIHDI